MEDKVYLLLGSNEGNRAGWLQQCIDMLEEKCGVIIAQSGIYETAAWGLEEQPDFLNMAVCLSTPLSPGSLLVAIQDIEKKLGRQRIVKWGQRTLDIDILFFGNEIINIPGLIVPHPYIQQRRFALAPLQEIAPALVHPVFKKSVTTLLEECPDPLEVRKVYNSLPPVV